MICKVGKRYYINKVESCGTGDTAFVKVFRGFLGNFYDII